jgi:hypothetical protein
MRVVLASLYQSSASLLGHVQVCKGVDKNPPTPANHKRQRQGYLEG